MKVKIHFEKIICTLLLETNISDENKNAKFDFFSLDLLYIYLFLQN